MDDLVDLFADPDIRPHLLASVMGLLLGLLLLILVHEGGHALCGRLAGYRVRFVRIGRGPTLVRLHLGLALLDWRLLPISGGVAVYQPFVRRRGRRLLLSAGGCLANAITAGVLYTVVPWPPDPFAHPVLTPVLLAQAAGCSCVRDPERLRHLGAVGVCGGRHDAVHHGGRAAELAPAT